MGDILEKVHEAGLTLKAGCGIGYEFSTLRPKGAYVTGAGAYTSGPLSFMDIYDRMCFTVSSAGGRRGAQMATFDVGHPDVLDFIRAKREDGRLRQFNLSLLITREFMEAVRSDSQWRLAFPLTVAEVEHDGVDLDDPDSVVWRGWPVNDDYVTNEIGQVACRVYRSVRARRIWDVIMSSTYDFAEPGFILIDDINDMNNNWFCENIRATNPCGEQPLPPYGSCLLGSINLTRFVLDPFHGSRAVSTGRRTAKSSRSSPACSTTSWKSTDFPSTRSKTRFCESGANGMGYLGLGSTLAMLRMRYGSDASIEFTERVTREMAVTGWKVALSLSLEKGPAPIMEESFPVTAEMLARRPEMERDGLQVGDTVKGRVLHSKYSRYMQTIAESEPALVAALGNQGARFTHHTSIAPTGTISLSLANNASNGIEPSFAHHYSRNVIREGRKTKEKIDVFSFELLAYRELVDDRAMPDACPRAMESGDDGDHPLPDYFVTAEDVTPKQHVDIQAAAQRWVDSSISKTANVPTDYPYDDFKDIYLYACERNLKGCTTFRFNPSAFSRGAGQGEGSREHDLSVRTRGWNGRGSEGQ